MTRARRHRRAARVYLTTAIVAVASLAVAVAQPSLDVSGRWTLAGTDVTAVADEWRAHSEPWGEVITLTQDAARVTVQQEMQGIPVTFLYRLDGSESRNLWPSVDGRTPMDVASRAAIEDGRLVITTSYAFNRGETARVVVVTRSITRPAADTLVVEIAARGIGDDDEDTAALMRRSVYRKR